MAARTPKEVFLLLLSDVRNGSEKAEKIYQELAQVSQDPQVKEVLDARAFISNKTRATLDECFRILGEKPVSFSGRFQETLLEDIRKEVKEIESPNAKRIFVLAKLNHLAQFRIGEYQVLTAAADAVGNHGVGLLLESCLADKQALVERTRHFIRSAVEARLAERATA